MTNFTNMTNLTSPMTTSMTARARTSFANASPTQDAARHAHSSLFHLSLLAVLLAVALFSGNAHAQAIYGPPKAPPSRAVLLIDPTSAASLNPLQVLDSAGMYLTGDRAGPATSGPSAPGKEKGGLSGAVNVLVLITIMSLAPSIMLMTTCFMRIMIVLGLLKQALGAPTIPPPQVITALGLFMTLLVMSPTIDRINAEAVAPYRAGEITDYDQLWSKAKQPVRDFMFSQIEATDNWSSVYMILEYRGVDVSRPENLTRADVDMVSLVPAYILSELKTAFLMGFRVYLPFLVIDMVISSVLISMSMMMLPPVLISLPFKLLLFVMVDGWSLVVGSLMHSFALPLPELGAATPVLQDLALGTLRALREGMATAVPATLRP